MPKYGVMKLRLGSLKNLLRNQPEEHHELLKRWWKVRSTHL